MDDTGPAAAILAGGHARRFGGRDKSRLVIDGRTIIVRQLDVLQRVASEIFVVGPTDGRFDDLGLRAIPDRIPGLGAIGGLHTALEAAATDPVIVVACDLPHLSEGLLRLLVERSAGVDAAWVRSARGPEPLLACYRQVAAGAIGREAAAGRLKLGDLGRVLRVTEVHGPDLARFGREEDLVANVNAPGDYTRLQSDP